MGGFQNQLLNQNFKQRFYDIIMTALIRGCELMVEDCSRNRSAIQNHEGAIRTHLLENYLENEEKRHQLGLENIYIRFVPEASEHYDSSRDTYAGRTDIRVVSIDWFKNKNDYYTIECKRIDWTSILNRKYVDEGICRFIGDNPKYLSYHHRNIMLGFVVKNIVCKAVISAIADIHTKQAGDMITKNITLVKREKDYCICESSYTNKLSLNHIFYNVSDIISL